MSGKQGVSGMNADGPIVILTTSAGAGHIVAARALEHAFRVAAPEIEVAVHDVLAACNGFFRRLYGGGYLALANHAPFAMGLLYDLMDRPNQHGRDALRLAFQNLHVHPTMRYLIRRQPRLIVSTHILPAEIAAYLRRRGRVTCPHVTVTTDFETHRLWVHAPTERYYAATEAGKAYLLTWGVDPRRILVTGIPIRAGFEEPADRLELRRRHDLDPRLPVVLLLCGGFGVGPTEALFDELMRLSEPAQVVVITGRNERLRVRLAELARPVPRRVHVVGFTDHMHEWMQAADLAVSKPGGLTVSEALVCGLPLVIISPIPGQESRNSDYLLEHGAAIRVNNPRLLAYRVAELLHDPPRLQACRNAARAIARPGAAARIVTDALELTRPGAGLTGVSTR